LTQFVQKHERQFVFDDFAWKLAKSLLEDFKPFVSCSFYDAAYEAFASCNVERLRALACGDVDSYEPYHLKTTRQICDLFKKFSFSQDLRTPGQLRDDSVKKFTDNQARLQNFLIPDDKLVRAIVFGARGYADQILGDFSHLEICEKATFGKKSSVGIPMRYACESARYEAPITGSRDQITWFDKYYGVWNRPAHGYAQARAVLLKKPPYREISSLEAVLVDKTWKSLRMIMPNTTIGTLYSGGLGKVIEDRLRSHNYDIRHLQPVHGELARFGSITGSLVTADQSMASDNITVQLIDAILPRPWASALKLGRISEMSLYGQKLDSPTFATMGIGFTFPLQTLVFLCILLSIRDECGLDEHTVVSVFGDDLIYDERMHEIVSTCFPALGLVLNMDKTYATGNFRESCGFDYYRGIDVRPFHLGRATGLSVGKRRAEAYLYVVVNSLMRRWNAYEVPSTLKFLLDSIREIRGNEVLLVPTDYPDTSGVKASPYSAYLFGLDRKIKKDLHGTFKFRFLSFETDLRPEVRHDPYLFTSLRRKSSVDVSFPWARVHGYKVGDVLREKEAVFTDLPDPEGRSFRSSSGKRLRPQLTFISEQDRGRFRERPGVTSNWTPEIKTKLPS